MSRMGCMNTINSTVGLGGVKKRPRRFDLVGKGISSHHMELPPLTFEEWKKVTRGIDKFPQATWGIRYGAYLSRFRGRS